MDAVTFMFAYLLGIMLVVYVIGYIKEDGLKKLAAKLVRFVESRKRKKRKRQGV